MTGMGERSQQVSPGKSWQGQISRVGAAKRPQRPSLAPIPVAGRLSVELDYDGGMDFRLQASDLIPDQPCSGVSVLYPLAPLTYLDLRCPYRPFWGTGLTVRVPSPNILISNPEPWT